MSDTYPTVADLVLSGSGSDGLRQAAEAFACFSAWSVPDVAAEIRRSVGDSHLDSFPVDPVLVAELAAIVTQAEEADRIRRGPSDPPTFRDRLAAMTVGDLFDPAQDERLGELDPVEAFCRRPGATSVGKALRAHPDMGAVTLLDFHERFFETVALLSSRPGFGKAVMSEIRRRAWIWIGGVERDPETGRPEESFFRDWRSEVVAASPASPFDLAMDFVGPRRAQALKLRHGLDGSGRRTLAQVAAEVGVSVAHASKLAHEGFRRLRHPTPAGLLRRHLASRPAGVDPDERDRFAASVLDGSPTGRATTPLEPRPAG